MLVAVCLMASKYGHIEMKLTTQVYSDGLGPSLTTLQYIVCADACKSVHMCRFTFFFADHLYVKYNRTQDAAHEKNMCIVIAQKLISHALGVGFPFVFLILLE